MLIAVDARPLSTLWAKRFGSLPGTFPPVHWTIHYNACPYPLCGPSVPPTSPTPHPSCVPCVSCQTLCCLSSLSLCQVPPDSSKVSRGGTPLVAWDGYGLKRTLGSLKGTFLTAPSSNTFLPATRAWTLRAPGVTYCQNLCVISKSPAFCLISFCVFPCIQLLSMSFITSFPRCLPLYVLLSLIVCSI